MTVAIVAICFGVALVGVASLLGWQIYRGDARSDQLTTERAAHSKTRLELERATWERDQHAKEIDAANRTIDALVKERSNAKPNGDLDKRDVVTRLVRAAAEQARAARTDRAGEVPAGDKQAVPAREPAAADKAPAVLPVGPLDPNEPLL